MIKMQYASNYTADNLDYRIFNEERTITQEIDKIVVLDFGAYFTDNLVIRNKETGLKLRRGTDYECTQLDFVATKLSGKEVATRIWIKTDAIKNIQYDYMFVGGDHMSGLHLLKALRKKYPNGLVNTYEWDKVTNKPETFRPKFHQMHVKDLYGFDGVGKSLDRIIAGVTRTTPVNTTDMLNRVIGNITKMRNELNDDIAELDETLQTAFDNLSVQDGEYIFSDSQANPVVLRGYGNWVRVTNTILRGTNGEASFAVDDGNVLALGSQVILRNCYVWCNKQTAYHPTYSLTAQEHIGYGQYQRVEEKDIIYTLQTTGITTGGKVGWVLIDDSTNKVVSRDLIYGNPIGEFVIDASGRGTVAVKFKGNTNTANLNKSYTLRLASSTAIKLTLTIIDITNQHTATLWFSSDVAGTKPLVSVNEGQDFYLNINTKGYTLGENVYLDWGYSSVTQAEMITVLPSILSNTSSNKISYKLKAKEDMLTDGVRSLIAYVVQKLEDNITSSTPVAIINITDTSKAIYADISFNAGGVNNVFEVNEGDTFTINVKTPLPNDELELQFESSRSLSDFHGLASLVFTNSNGACTLTVTNIEDFLTAKGTQNLTVIAFYKGVEIGRNNIYFKDTSQSPDYELFYSATPGGTPITQITEGAKFYFNIRVTGWKTTANPPVLNFLYYLNDQMATPITEMNSRIISAFYENMTFASSSSVFNEVSWLNDNTLSLEMTTIANKLVDGDDILCIAVKQSNENDYSNVAKLKLIDSSIYNITVTLSSSPTILTPITSVNEMLSNGLNNTAYLWIDVDGDGSLLGDITLKSDSVAGVDFVDVFPKTIRFPEGSNRQIVSITLKADFNNESDKTVYISGEYNVVGDNRVQEIFNISLNIIDNSIKTEISAVASTSALSVTPAPGGFSEWNPIYVILSFPAFAFESKVDWNITYQDITYQDITYQASTINTSQFINESGTIVIPAGASSALITLDPKRDRIVDGEASFNLNYQRFINADNRAITNPKVLSNIRLLDDSLPPAVGLKLYSDAARTNEITSVNEGQTVYLRLTTINPDRNSSVSIRLTNATNVSKTVNGVTMIAYGENQIPTKLELTDNRKIVANYDYSTENKVYTFDTSLKIIGDRTTNPNPVALDLTVELLSNTDNTAVGTTLTDTYINANLITKAVVLVPINDTSKTATYSVVASAASVDEGVNFDIKLNTTNGTVGDVYYPSLTSSFLTTRLETNQLGLEQLSVVDNDVITWRFKAAKNYFTDVTTDVFTVDIINKTTGSVVGTKTVTINDTSKTPDFNLSIVDSTLTALTSITEGDTSNRLYIENVANVDDDETYKVEWVSGRAESEFESGVFGTFPWSVVIDGSGNTVGSGNTIPFYPRYDRKTNTAAENTVTIKVTAVLGNVSKTLVVPINDTSKDMAFTASRWVLAGTETVVTSVDEGTAVELQVQTTGGAETISLTCVNDNGRDPSKLTVSSYGVTKTRSSNTEWVKFPFTPATDELTNNGNDLKLSVKINVIGSDVMFTSTLPINDTSNAATFTLKIVEFGDATQTPVTYMLENKTYQLFASGANVPPAATVKLRANINSYYHTTPINDEISGHGGSPNFAVRNVSLSNSVRTPSNALWYQAMITIDDVIKALITLPVVDNGIPQIAARLTSIEDINTAISGVATGNTISLVIDPSQLTGIDWDLGTDHVIRWKLVNDSTEAVLANPTVNDSSKTFKATDLTSFNGGNGYKTNIPIGYALSPQVAKVILFEEYVVGGILQSVRLGSTGSLNIVAGSTAPAITGFYYSTNAEGSDVITSANEGDTIYLIVKTANIPLNTDININWDGTTTNSNDFQTATTDSDITIRITNFNSVTNEGLGYYKLDSLSDERVDYGKNITSVKLVNNKTTMAEPAEILVNTAVYLVIDTLGLRVGDKVEVTLQTTMSNNCYLDYNGTKLFNNSTFMVAVASSDANTMVGRTVLTLVARSQ